MDTVVSFLFVCLCSIHFVSSLHEKCDKNEDCIKKDEYCYMVNKVCAPCTDNVCHIYNREKSGNKCPSNSMDCGSCLPGFEEEILADGTKSERCILTPIEHSDESGYANYLITIAVVAFAVSLVGGTFFATKKWRGRSVTDDRKSIDEQNDPIIVNSGTLEAATAPRKDYDESPPPPYNTEFFGHRQQGYMPVNNASHGSSVITIENEEHEPFLSKQTFQKEMHLDNSRGKIVDNLQQAAIFRDPDYLQADCGESIEEELSTPELTTSPPDLDDDTTQPSFWTPTDPHIAADEPLEEVNEIHEVQANGITEESKGEKRELEDEEVKSSAEEYTFLNKFPRRE